ncbi:hypothetical protein [Prosthecobacter sp.]
MRQISHSMLCCLLLALESQGHPCRAEETSPAAKQLLLTTLKECQKSQAILSLAGHTRTFQEGKARSDADFTAMLPLNGSQSRMILAYTPYVSLTSKPHMEDVLKTTFNGRYWTKINYSRGLAGTRHSMDRTIAISKDRHPLFAYQYRTGCQLFMPLVRFKETGGSFSLLQLLEGHNSYAFKVTEEKRGDTPVLKVTLPPDEWLILDPARDGVVLEYVTSGKDWREEARALKVERTASGMWFATDFVYTDTIKGKELLRYETKITNVTVVDQAAMDQEIQPRFGPGWSVKDERTGEEYKIQDDAEEIFKKIDAVKP